MQVAYHWQVISRLLIALLRVYKLVISPL
ncbi:membrane protein, partial [Xanthomonas phaseoli pv. phaseoli]